MPLSSDSARECREVLRGLVDRIKAVLEDERKMLLASDFDGLDRIVARKGQLAIELSLYAKGIDPRTVDKDTRELLEEGARTLRSNADLLRRHIEAVSDVAGLISNILVNANSDGTYSNRVSGPGLRP